MSPADKDAIVSKCHRAIGQEVLLSAPSIPTPVPSKLCFLMFCKLLSTLPGSLVPAGSLPWLPCHSF